MSSDGLLLRLLMSAVSLQVVPGGKRWLMTGTPLQNTPEELYSYFHFLRYAPFDSRTAFQKLFSRRAGDLQAVVAALRSIVRPVMLRRTKRSRIDGALVMPLPPRQVFSWHLISNLRLQALRCQHAKSSFFMRPVSASRTLEAVVKLRFA